MHAINFIKHKNLPTDGWGRINKFNYDWHSGYNKSARTLNFDNKKHKTCVPLAWHSSEASISKRERSENISDVNIPRIV